MVYTLTLNPSIDYVVYLDTLVHSAVNRTTQEQLLIGGKGINVSLILSQLQIPNVAMGITAGFTGEQILLRLKEFNIQNDFVHQKSGESRINVKIKAEKETEINAEGPQISESSAQKLLEKIEKLDRGDVLILSGSVPRLCAIDIYEKILERLNKDVQLAVDITGERLLLALKYQPLLIKPNNIELGEIFETQIRKPSEAEPFARILQEKGAQNVLVSFGENGAFLLDKNGNTHIMASPKGKLVNSTGAGDSMFAAFLAEYMNTGDYDSALKLGVAAGAATAFNESLAKREQIYEVLDCL